MLVFRWTQSLSSSKVTKCLKIKFSFKSLPLLHSRLPSHPHPPPGGTLLCCFWIQNIPKLWSLGCSLRSNVILKPPGLQLDRHVASWTVWLKRCFLTGRSSRQRLFCGVAGQNPSWFCSSQRTEACQVKGTSDIICWPKPLFQSQWGKLVYI